MDPQILLNRIRWNSYNMGYNAGMGHDGREFHDRQADKEFLKIAADLKEAQDKIKRLEAVIDNSTRQGIGAIFKLADSTKEKDN